jgi:lipoate-protein ligase A
MLDSKIDLKLIKLQNTSIFDQLKLEEFLLRDTQDNYCIINYGSSPAIVMGISGKLDELVHKERAKELQIPVIKRFSGGGTVVIDPDTIFITFIFNASQIKVPGFPEPIYRFTESLYHRVFKDITFELKQNDYVIGDRKFGGNAQYIKKDRWLHHTSFLWDYKKHHMDLLKHPQKTPEYRQGRSHEEFITKLSSHYNDIDQILHIFISELEESFQVAHHNSDYDPNLCSRISTDLVF